MSLLERLFPHRAASRGSLDAIYAAVVAEARRPGWYRDAGAPDTLDGRFDMVAAILALVLIRLEREGAAGASPAALLTERFVADMDGQLRQAGVGDVMVGKHVGRMMGALGGRLAAYRAGLAEAGDGALGAALVRNLFRGAAPAPARLAKLVADLRRFDAELAAVPLAALLAGELAR